MSSQLRIGDRSVRRIGFGAMHLGGEREPSIAVLRRAVELGVQFIDTAHLYGWGANEELIAEALHPYPEDVLVATKVGVAPPDGDREARICGDPAFLREQVDDGLRRLRVERLELLQLHRVDTGVPLADQVGTLGELRDAGKIGHIGLSEVSVGQLREAEGIVPITSVQNRYNLLDREYDDVLDACTAAGIAFLPWRPVLPGVQAGGEVAAVAAELGATPAQVSLAWLLGRSPQMLPIPGTTSQTHLAENVAAAAIHLTTDQRTRLDDLLSDPVSHEAG